jgi:hypothetical protein
MLSLLVPSRRATDECPPARREYPLPSESMPVERDILAVRLAGYALRAGLIPIFLCSDRWQPGCRNLLNGDLLRRIAGEPIGWSAGGLPVCARHRQSMCTSVPSELVVVIPDQWSSYVGRGACPTQGRQRVVRVGQATADDRKIRAEAKTAAANLECAAIERVELIGKCATEARLVDESLSNERKDTRTAEKRAELHAKFERHALRDRGRAGRHADRLCGGRGDGAGPGLPGERESVRTWARPSCQSTKIRVANPVVI